MRIMPALSAASAKLYLGCPVWAHAPWRGTFFTRDAARRDFLPQYASVFDTAEGNATFYGLPSAETVARWAAEAPATFRFCFKFPRTITHDLHLVNAEAATTEFLLRLAPLQGRLGPFFLQLHQSFDARRVPDLAAYLRTLPSEFSYAVEVRSPDFFAEDAAEQALDAMLAERNVERVNFDTRGLFASTATDEFTSDAKRKKPRVPLRHTAIGAQPFVRFVGDPNIEKNDLVLREWAHVVARWLEEGRTPFFFLHHPDDAHAPALVRRFQNFVCALSSVVPPPATWPAERELREGAQLSLL
jgi:uncharacterized protein YecE (DUF72 family)